eukprot:g2048.t1
MAISTDGKGSGTHLKMIEGEEASQETEIISDNIKNECSGSGSESEVIVYKGRNRKRPNSSEEVTKIMEPPLKK